MDESMSNDECYLLFAIYRWPGTSVEEFRNHLRETHGPLAKRFPGLAWYESFLTDNAQEGWPVTSAPAPDAFAIMKFDSEAAKQEAAKSPAWAEADADLPGFIGHFNVFAVDRITWVPGK
ncbi:EthD family reductase [Amycolatopsis pithecellobii]|uniref:EthD family reductase n=1 Tax=Amycolatopsis pithecellobii TaxID=664692 RepID=A0A6N7YHV9_9PSEU|nr:EthD family reductase [Amycolatopsis pithecellobii]MTD52475.1 EthD family reductase [Amycolatopsis pithecellobii]